MAKQEQGRDIYILSAFCPKCGGLHDVFAYIKEHEDAADQQANFWHRQGLTGTTDRLVDLNTKRKVCTCRRKKNA